MTDGQAIETLQKITGIEYSVEQRAIMESKGGIRILACAGSGKTTVLTHLITKRILTGEITDTSKVLCTTYSKEGSKEMEQRLNILLSKAGVLDKVSVTTIHAFYYRLLKRFGFAFNVCLKRLPLITKAVKELQLKLPEDAIANLDSIMSYQVNNMLTTEALCKHPIFTVDITPEQYNAVTTLFAQYKAQEGEIDFDDMQLLVYQKLCTAQMNKDMLEYCRTNWKYYYIDEFQDVSKLQYEIFKAFIVDSTGLVVIGDDDQSIYSWRGADPSIILNIGADYSIKSYTLNTNYRCGGEIVRRAAELIKNNRLRAQKDIRGYSEEGVIKLCMTPTDLYGKSKQVYNYIISLIEDGVSPADIAVIARNNAHLSILNSLLFRSNIFADVREEMKISSSYLYKDMKDIIELAKDCYNYVVAEGLLWKLIPYLSIYGSRVIGSIMKTTGLDLIDALCYALHNYSFRYAGSMNPSDTILSKPVYSRLGEKFRTAFADKGEIALYKLYKILLIDDKALKVQYLMELYVNASAFLYSSKDKQRILSAYVQYMSDLIKDDYEVGVSYLNLQEQYERGEILTSGEKITLTTAHSAKGKEWKYVVLMLDDNIAFPSLDAFAALLDRDREFAYRTLDEERRLHYVAMTRAKEELIVMTDPQTASVFLYEAYGLKLGNGLIERILKTGITPNATVFNNAATISLSDTAAIKQIELRDDDIVDIEPATISDLA